MTITVVSGIIIVIYTIMELNKSTFNLNVLQLKRHALLLASQIGRQPDALPQFNDLFLSQLAQKTQMRYTLISPNGTVFADSHVDHEKIENHRDRPELINALADGFGTDRRFSETYGRTSLYVAVPVYNHRDSIVSIARVAIPTLSISESISPIRSQILIVTLVILSIGVLLSVFISNKLSFPLVKLRDSALSFTPKTTAYSFYSQSSISEIVELSSALNTMATQLVERINRMAKQKSEQDAILASMIEGVIAIDSLEHVVLVNKAAGTIFGFDICRADGKLVQELIRNTAFLSLIRQTLKTNTPQKQEIHLYSDHECAVEVHATMVQATSTDGAATPDVVLCVAHDITHLKKLELLRKEFVANVSHELRTPLTSIKGYVETLIDGAINEPAEAVRFLQIIDTHVDRLNTLIEDLLTLSKLEKDEHVGDIEFSSVILKTVVAEAIDAVNQKAVQKNTRIETVGELSQQVVLNASLFQQAIINLLDNAITYSKEGTTVTLEAGMDDDHLKIAITDQGVGISKLHCERLFERFYRVDKARSRKAGGTGLGLSIVKHIVTIHQGVVTVESELGKGSVFTIIIPRLPITTQQDTADA